ncbi:MAG TPA: hypothetical protein VHQ86_02690, partial [Candidatus Saccharimonadia bacterium]|nr:hypothetical protein [Candidatus Saccharimonadia bacterium]
MLATIGFIAAAVLLLIFGGMFIWLVRDSEEPMYNFGLAYIVVAIAFLMWGVLSLINGIGLLIASIVLGDGLLISASMAAVSIVIPHGLKIASYIL